MSGERQVASSAAWQENLQRAKGAAALGIPALQQRQGAINAAIAGGEPAYMKSAFAGQRGALAEGITGKGSDAAVQQAFSSKGALSGGNNFANWHPADIGAQLANALYGSQFAEGQANIDQTMNLFGMALGGAGSAGSGALTAAGQQLGAIQYQPGYNQTYANVLGGLSAGASIYGMLNKYGLFDPRVGNPGGTPPVDQWGQSFNLGSPQAAFGGPQSFGLGSINWGR